MIMERYTEQHKQSFLKLLSLRQMDVAISLEIPSYGVIVYECGEPVCLGFLRSVEGGYGMIDGLMTNPEFSPAIRHESLNLVVGAIIEAAKEFKMKLLMAFTSDDSVKGRASAFKFDAMPHTLIKLNLEET